jgi:hypothetical protein
MKKNSNLSISIYLALILLFVSYGTTYSAPLIAPASPNVSSQTPTTITLVSKFNEYHASGFTYPLDLSQCTQTRVAIKAYGGTTNATNNVIQFSICDSNVCYDEFTLQSANDTTLKYPTHISNVYTALPSKVTIKSQSSRLLYNIGVVCQTR